MRKLKSVFPCLGMLAVVKCDFYNYGAQNLIGSQKCKVWPEIERLAKNRNCDEGPSLIFFFLKYV